MGARTVILEAHIIRGIQQGRVTRLYLPAPNDSPPLKIGHAYPIKERFTEVEGGREVLRMPTCCYVEVIAQEVVQLHAATDHDARTAGFPDRLALFVDWKERHGETPAAVINGQWRQFDVPAWAVDFQLDNRRYLKDWSKGAVADYTHSPGGAPKGERDQTVEPEWLEDHAKRRREAFAESRQDLELERKADRLIAKLRHLRARARNGEDVSAELAATERALDQQERKAA